MNFMIMYDLQVIDQLIKVELQKLIIIINYILIYQLYIYTYSLIHVVDMTSLYVYTFDYLLV